jgi:hypothetical protein
MRGARAAKTFVAEFLRAEFPSHLAVVRAELDLEESDLPAPVRYKVNETQALDEWPMIAVAAVRVLRMRRREVRPPDTVFYDVTYSLRAYLWVRETEWDHAIEVRDDLSGALRRLLVDRQTLKVAGDVARVREETVVEEFSDVTPVKGDRFVTGSYVGFDLELEETLTRAGGGTVGRAVVLGDALPHPALEGA